MATKVLACHFMKLVYQFKLDCLDCRNCSLLHFGSRQGSAESLTLMPESDLVSSAIP